MIRQRIGINEAQQQAANAELQRRVSLGATGIVAGSQVEAARAAQATSTGEGRVAQAELERLNRQRQDEVTIQLADLDARIGENEARVHQTEKQLQEWPAPFEWSGLTVSALSASRRRLVWPAELAGVGQPATPGPRELVARSRGTSAVEWCCNAVASPR